MVQKRIQAREDASLAREKTTLQHVQELEARIAGFDSKEKKMLRVRLAGRLSFCLTASLSALFNQKWRGGTRNWSSKCYASQARGVMRTRNHAAGVAAHL